MDMRRGQRTRSRMFFLEPCYRNMKLFIAFICFIAMISAAACLEATEGKNVTISLETAELDRADKVTITRTRGSETKKIVQYCHCVYCGDCKVVETPGVLLRVKEGILILVNISSKDSGLYKVEVIRRNNNKVTQQVTLVVNRHPFPSREPPQTSISKPPQTSSSKPPNSSERQRIYVVIAPVVFIMAVIFFVLLCRCRRTQYLQKKKKNWEGNFKDGVAVSLKTCRGDTEDQLMDT